MFKCRLKVIFAEKKINQNEFAKRVKISESALSQLVQDRALPNLTNARNISNELNVPILDIWVWEDDKR